MAPGCQWSTSAWSAGGARSCRLGRVKYVKLMLSRDDTDTKVMNNDDDDVNGGDNQYFRSYHR